MLRTTLIHPPLLAALAALGHGSKLLVADGNYPAATARPPGSTVIHLNVAPGMLTVTEVLTVLLTAINAEEAIVMAPPPDQPAPVHDEFATLLGPGVPLHRLGRFEFYDAVRSDDTGLIIATGEERIYANLLLTVGLR